MAISNVSYTFSHQVFPKWCRKNTARDSIIEKRSAHYIQESLISSFHCDTPQRLCIEKWNKRQMRSKCQHQHEYAFVQKIQFAMHFQHFGWRERNSVPSALFLTWLDVFNPAVLKEAMFSTKPQNEPREPWGLVFGPERVRFSARLLTV